MKNLSKHFQTIGKAKHLTSRPILQGIHYNHTIDALEMTDSHRLLQVKIGYQLPGSFTYHYTTLEPLEGNYPDTTRLIPNTQDVYFEKANIDPTLYTKVAAFKKELIQLKRDETTLYINQENGNTIGTIQINKNNEIPEMAYVNGQYLTDIFALIKDYYSEARNAAMIINFTLFSPVRPLVFSNDDFTYLCTPVRKS